MRKGGTPLASPQTNNHSAIMKPSVSSSSISSRMEGSTSASSLTQQQTSQSRGFPTRLASLKREDEGPSPYSNSQTNAGGSSGRTSPASFRSRTITASDRTQATSPEPTMRNESSFTNDRSQKMNASGSETSLASNFHPDPRRNAMQQQQQQSQYEQQQQHESQIASQHRANESQTSFRSQDSSERSYHQDQNDDARSRDGRNDREDEDDFQERGITSDKHDMSDDPEAWADLKVSIPRHLLFAYIYNLMLT